MLSPTKWDFLMYMPLITKLVEGNPFLIVVWVNFEFFVMWIYSIHCFVWCPYWRLSMRWSNCTKERCFCCEYVATNKICQGQLYIHCSNPTMKYTSDVFKDFHDLIDYMNNTWHLKLKASSLDLNTWGVEYLWFDFAGFTFWATSLNAHGKKMQVF
jgi:hypothetical protein